MESTTVENQKIIDNNHKEIIFLESAGSFTRKYCCNGSDLLLADELSRLEDALPNEKFFKINHLNIINVDYLKKIKGKAVKNVLLQGGIELKISDQKYNDLLMFLKSKYEIW